MTIAVFVNRYRLPCAAHEAEHITFFEKRSGEWAETHSRRVQPLQSTAASALQGFLDEITTLTQDAQAVAAASIAGRVYTAFHQRGKHIFEITDITPGQLSGIAEDIALAEAQKALAEDAFQSAHPAETDIEGSYTLDMVTVLEEFPALSSKMILKPFLKNTPFTELTVICRHIPQWLLQERELQIRTKQRGEVLVMTIQKQHCGEAIL